MQKIVFLWFFCFMPGLLLAQKAIDRSRQIDTAGKKDLVDVAKAVLHIGPKPIDTTRKKKVDFSLLPTSYSVPGGGTALFTSTVFGFYSGDRKTTYLSTVTFTPYFNFHRRFGLPLRSSIWTKDNTWNIQGDTRFLVYPQYTWGLGGHVPEFNKFVVHYQYIRFYQSALKRITPYFYVGAGYNMDYYLDIETDNPNALRSFTGYPYGTSSDHNSFSSGVTVNALYDTRNNDLNPLPGSYTNVVYRVNMMGLGSDANWQSLYIDLRKYISLTSSKEQNVLAFWTYYWRTFGTGIPYLSLPSIGWDPYQRSGRGIEQNRYRGKRLLYFETEYRRDISTNGLLGFVVFANINSASEPVTNNFNYWHPAAGAGLRIKMNKRTGTNIALDYGVSREYSRFTLGLGEAF
ncbi:MAG TPA: BamA/TamA family outer membrane protein [Mucilaginibacter sp.]|nr:BamA/TamA family outer membrane protein [Mucilaginibacter sp.]